MEKKPMRIRLGHQFAATPADQSSDEWLIEGYAYVWSAVPRGLYQIPASAVSPALDEYMAFGMVSVFHDHSKPVARAIAAQVDQEGLWVQAMVSKSEPGVWTKIEEGILSAFSIEFVIEDFDFDEERELIQVKRLRLLDVSIVPLPEVREARFEVAGRRFSASEEDAEEIRAMFRPRSVVAEDVPGESPETGDANGRSVVAAAIAAVRSGQTTMRVLMEGSRLTG